MIVEITGISGNNFFTKGENFIQVFEYTGIEENELWTISNNEKNELIFPFSMSKKIEVKINTSIKTVIIYPHQAIALFLEGVITEIDFAKSCEDENEILLTDILIAGYKRNLLIINRQ